MNTEYPELHNKVAIVTGGAQGIGLATATLLAQTGVRVVMADIEAAKGAAAAQQINAAGGAGHFALTDVGEHAQIRELVDQTVQEWGRLDFVVNNAYWSVRKDVVELEEWEWDKGMAVMLKAAYLFGKHAFPHMQAVGGGAMVNISSVHGMASIPRYPVYATAKAGLINLTRQMAIDGGPHNIRVNAILPGWIQTRGPASLPEKTAQKMRKLYPLGRGGEPHEIATVVRFLLSNQASFVTGHAWWWMGD
ncbi:MAG: SDR family oxidoreductase [Caldilineaceae bacterium]